MTMSRTPAIRRGIGMVAIGCWSLMASEAAAQTLDTISLRGHAQTLHLYGKRGGSPVIVSSGDGGWIHLGPHVAEWLASQGFFVVGVDVKAYLESFTSAKATLRAEDAPGDYKTLVDYAARGAGPRPVLIGVSEGAGLSVLAATDPAIRSVIAGVIALGLPDVNELGWRWRDSLIYLTHSTPKEPTFSATGIIGGVSPLPFAAIYSTHDEFVPLPEARRVVEAAGEPKRLWVVTATDHRFSDNEPELDRRLLEAIEWVRANLPK